MTNHYNHAFVMISISKLKCRVLSQQATKALFSL